VTPVNVTPAAGAPEIEFHRRSLASFYFVVTILAVLIGILLMMVGLGTAVEPGPWSGKWLSVVEWCVFGLGWICGGPQFWKMGRNYQDNFIRLGPSEITFHSVSGKHFQIPYAEIRAVDFDASVRKRALTITTADTTYTLDQRNCPSIGKVAEIVKAHVAAMKPPPLT
jgi:hypothetical protein